MSKPTILVNLNRCTGCWTCSMACKVAYDLEDGEWWSRIRTIGGGRIDEPSGEWPAVDMSWMPVFTEKCILCPSRRAEGLEPYCTYNCPTKALTFGDLDDPKSAASERLAELQAKGFEQVPADEADANRNVIYLKR